MGSVPVDDSFTSPIAEYPPAFPFRQLALCAVPGQIGAGDMDVGNGRAEYAIDIGGCEKASITRRTHLKATSLSPRVQPNVNEYAATPGSRNSITKV
jgi:hypothetical protein